MSSQSKTHHETAPEDRVSLKEKIGLVLAGWGGIGGGTANSLNNFIFVMELGVSPALLSSFNFATSIISSFVGPLVGQYSDNFRSPWGRRRPLLLMASIPMVLFGCMPYAFPNGRSETFLATWLFIWGLLAMIPTAVYNLSLQSLQTEAVRDYHERVRLVAFLTFFGLLIGLTSQWIYPFVKNQFPPLIAHLWGMEIVLFKFPVFVDPVTGARWVVLGFGIFALICSQCPIFLCSETRYAQVKKAQPKGKLIPSLKEAIKNRQFLIILSIKFFTFFCYSVVGVLGMYMNTYFVFGGDKARGSVIYAALATSYTVAAWGSLLFFRWLEPKMGKIAVLRLSAGILMFDCICKLFVYQPSMPWLQLIVLMGNGVSVTGLHLITGSMFGDIIDHDELLHYKRREALYGSIFSWAESQGVMLGNLISGFMLVWIGFNAKLTGPQSSMTLHLMQFFYFLFPFCGALFAFLAVGRYKLTETRMYEIRDDLNKRHAATKLEEEAQAALAEGASSA